MNSAYSDHSQAASVPTLISVSIVAAPCLRFAHAALWKITSTPRTAAASDSASRIDASISSILPAKSARRDLLPS